MTKTLKFQAALAMAAMLAMPMAQAATVSQADYNAGKSRIDANHTAEKAACASLAGNAKDICSEEAKGREKVARAELAYSYTGTPADANKIRVARAESAYAVARERCDDLAGNVKDVCVKEAKAVETKALAQARLGKEIGVATQDAAVEIRDADYTVAIEKCDALAGDAKAACVASAKARYGKT